MRVLIADANKEFRDSLRRLLEVFGAEVVGEAGSSRDLEDQVTRHRPDAVLMTLSPGWAGDETADQLLAALQHTKVVVLTATAGELDLTSALELGVWGYLLKALETGGIIELVRKLSLTLAAEGEPEGREALTRREEQVLELMALGVTSNRELARLLRVSENTLKFHVRNILDKLHLEDRTQAVGYTLRARAHRQTDRDG